MKIPVILQAEAVEKSVDSVEKFWDFTTISRKYQLFPPIWDVLILPICRAEFRKIYVTETAFRSKNFSVFAKIVWFWEAFAALWQAFSIFSRKIL